MDRVGVALCGCSAGRTCRDAPCGRSPGARGCRSAADASCTSTPPARRGERRFKGQAGRQRLGRAGGRAGAPPRASGPPGGLAQGGARPGRGACATTRVMIEQSFIVVDASCRPAPRPRGRRLPRSSPSSSSAILATTARCGGGRGGGGWAGGWRPRSRGEGRLAEPAQACWGLRPLSDAARVWHAPPCVRLVDDAHVLAYGPCTRSTPRSMRSSGPAPAERRGAARPGVRDLVNGSERTAQAEPTG